MKFKEFVTNVNEILKKHPETAKFEVVTSKDDEGNGFNTVHYTPSIGNYEDREFENDGNPKNAVCVN